MKANITDNMVEKKHKTYKIVLGSLYGDEGKGAVTQWLCKKEIDEGRKPVVVRFSGGAQAAHTVRQKLDNGKDITHICSSLGSGVLLGVDTYLDDMFFLDPIMLMNEIEALQIEIAESGSPLGKEFMPKVWINDWCRIVTPYDIIDNRNDRKARENGTCGKGVNSAFRRYNNKFGVYPWKKISVKSKENSLTEILKNPQGYLDRVKKYYDFPEKGNLNTLCWSVSKDLQVTSIEELDWMFCDAVTKINRLIAKDYIKIREEDFWRSGLYDTVIYEGSQGLLLDMENGFDPWTTSSRVGLNGIPRRVTKEKSEDFNPVLDTEVYLVTRSYLTRHGLGYGENHINTSYGDSYFRAVLEADDPTETNINNEFQGVFHRYVYDIGLLDRAIDRHNLDNYDLRFNLMITHADTIDRFVKYSGAEVADFKLPYFFETSPRQTDLWPVIDENGELKEVANVHQLKDMILKQKKGKFPLARKFVSGVWYSDSPYGDFKRC